MKKIFYLSSCNTCKKIIQQLNPGADVQLQDIKNDPITEDQIEQMKNLSRSYESLFSRRAIKYRTLGLKEKNLSEEDYKKLILDEYTFLKRPVIISDNQIFIGNSRKTVSQAQESMN